MPFRLYLFDIDGTLLLSGGAGARAIDRAFFDLFGLEDAFAGIHPDGKIDTGIFREIIEKKGVSVEDMESTMEILKEKYIAALSEEMPVSPAVLMPAVQELLAEMAQVPDSAMGLVTGNLEPGARLKAERFGLNKYFPFGGFGSDSEDRAQMVRVAVSRAEKYLNRSIPLGPDVFVIGDTPKDVACAKENNAIAVAVATGSYSVDQLLQAGADFAFEDFTDVAAVVRALRA